MYCKNCGNKLDNDAIFCTKCGTHKDSMVSCLYCEKCGSKFNKGAAFCTGYGTAIPEEILENRKKLLKKQKEQEKLKKIDEIGKIFVLGITVFVIISLIIAIFN